MCTAVNSLVLTVAAIDNIKLGLDYGDNDDDEDDDDDDDNNNNNNNNK
jgi:hypothetical protein